MRARSHVRAERVRSGTRENYRTEIRLYAAWVQREHLTDVRTADDPLFPASIDCEETLRRQVPINLELCRKMFLIIA